jgi:hypothetical protein
VITFARISITAGTNSGSGSRWRCGTDELKTRGGDDAAAAVEGIMEQQQQQQKCMSGAFSSLDVDVEVEACAAGQGLRSQTKSRQETQ